VGGNRTIHSDIRIITATNRNLEEQVADRTFEKISIIELMFCGVHLPPLRIVLIVSNRWLIICLRRSAGYA